MEDGFLPGIKMTWALDAPVHVVIGMERSLVTHRLAVYRELDEASAGGDKERGAIAREKAGRLEAELRRVRAAG